MPEKNTITTLDISENPFLLESEKAYLSWRESKLDNYPQTALELLVEVEDATRLSEEEYLALLQRCRKTNMAVYRITGGDYESKQTVRALGQRFGLQQLDNNLCADEDAITSLQVMSSGRHTGYIPYTNRPISWHTDGY